MDQYEYETLTDEEKIEALMGLSERAEADLNYNERCLICGKKVFFAEDTKGRVEGHIYSSAGQREFYISYCCEYCFDNAFATPGRG